MDLREEQTSGRDDAPETPRRPRRLLARASLVIVLMGLGAAVAVLVSSAMAVRYEASANVSLPGRLDATTLLSATGQTSFSGADGQQLEIVALADGIEFLGRGGDPELAARTANGAATAFVDSVADDAVTLSVPATAPASPSSPRRLQNALLGVGAGALLGLVMQAGLRPARRDESVEYLPNWTAEDTSSKAAPTQPSSITEPSDAEAEAGTATADINAGSPRPRPRSFQDAADPSTKTPPNTPVTTDLDYTVAEPLWADDKPSPITIPGTPSRSDEPDHGSKADTHGARASDNETAPAAPGDMTDQPEPTLAATDDSQVDDDRRDDITDITDAEIEDPETEDAEIDDAEIGAADTPDPGVVPAADLVTSESPDEGTSVGDVDLDEPLVPEGASRGFRDLVDRTSANLDPLIDRFAVDEDQFEEDLDLVTSTQPGQAAAQPIVDDGELVAQIAFLGDEVANYQRRIDDERSRHLDERAALIADHESSLERLETDLDRAHAEIERLRDRRDQARSQLEDRVSELETSLHAAQDQLERAQRNAKAEAGQRAAANEDLSSEVDFLRSEIERYQRTLDDERVSHSTAIAATRLENQEELDRTHREHRETLNQLAQTNRNFLTTQRNEAEAVITELEADHQLALDAAHQSYEQRLNEARHSYAERVAKIEERTQAELQRQRSTEVDELRDHLEAALEDARSSHRRVAELEGEVADSDRRVEQAQLAHAQAERLASEEQRQLVRRNEELTDLLNRTEQRLANERQRTNEVVRNLLRESASAASAADWARQGDSEIRDEIEATQRRELAILQQRLLALEQTAAEREASLEATIADLRQRLGASPNA